LWLVLRNFSESVLASQQKFVADIFNSSNHHGGISSFPELSPIPNHRILGGDLSLYSWVVKAMESPVKPYTLW